MEKKYALYDTEKNEFVGMVGKRGTTDSKYLHPDGDIVIERGMLSQGKSVHTIHPMPSDTLQQRIEVGRQVLAAVPNTHKIWNVEEELEDDGTDWSVRVILEPRHDLHPMPDRIGDSDDTLQQQIDIGCQVLEALGCEPTIRLSGIRPYKTKTDIGVDVLALETEPIPAPEPEASDIVAELRKHGVRLEGGLLAWSVPVELLENAIKVLAAQEKENKDD